MDRTLAVALKGQEHSGVGQRSGGLCAPRRNIRWQKSPVPQELLSIFWGHRQVIAGCTVAALVLAGVAHLLTVPKFSATAVIQFEPRNISAPGQTTPAAVMDAESLVESETRLIDSPALSRLVVDRLAREVGATRIAEVFPSVFELFDPGVTGTSAQLDRAASRLSGNMAIKNYPRTYLINVTYKAQSPEEASRIANAVVAQYLHNSRVQNLAGVHASAERTLGDLEVTYGPKHPQIIHAKANLAIARAQMEEAGQSGLMSEEQLVGTGQVIPARANSIPTGPSLSKILIIAVAIGLVLGLAIVQLLERQALRELLLRHLKYGSRHSARRIDPEATGRAVRAVPGIRHVLGATAKV